MAKVNEAHIYAYGSQVVSRLYIFRTKKYMLINWSHRKLRVFFQKGTMLPAGRSRIRFPMKLFGSAQHVRAAAHQLRQNMRKKDKSWSQHHDSDRRAAVFIISFVSTVLISFTSCRRHRVLTVTYLDACRCAAYVTETSTRNLPGGKGRPAHKADNVTTIWEPIF
jgi:hypothetical protein